MACVGRPQEKNTRTVAPELWSVHREQSQPNGRSFDLIPLNKRGGKGPARIGREEGSFFVGRQDVVKGEGASRR